MYHTWQVEENGKWYSKDGKQIDWQAMGNPGKWARHDPLYLLAYLVVFLVLVYVLLVVVAKV